MKTVGLDDEIIGFSGNTIKIDDDNDGKNNRYNHKDEREGRIDDVILCEEFSNRKESNNTSWQYNK